MTGKQSISRLMMILGLLCFAGHVRGAYEDDVGSSASEARALMPDAAATVAVINVDIDEDWFSFPAMPSVVYAIEVTDTTVWNTEVALIAPDAETGLYETNTATGGSPLSIRWTNWGTRATCYIEVNGLVEYTTGSYQVAVSRLNWLDVDEDGMLDTWETNKFGSLTNGADGDYDADMLTNLEEYYMGTHPADFSSGLFVSSVARNGNSVTVTWPSVRNGMYKILASSGIDDDGWSVLDNRLNVAGDSFMEFEDSNGATYPARFYHVRFLY